MSEVNGILIAGHPQACVQLIQGQREVRGGGRHTGDTGVSRHLRLNQGGSMSSVINAKLIQTFQFEIPFDKEGRDEHMGESFESRL